jgi:hypothetical protein
MFCLNSKKNEEDLERRKIEKFENERNYTNGLIVIFTLLGIIIFCIYYFNPFSFQKTQSVQIAKPQPVQIGKPVTKIFGPDDIISPLLTSSSETSSLK